MRSCRALCIVIVFLFSAQLQADECSSIRVGQSSNWFPVAYTNADMGTSEGIAIDVLMLLEQHLSIPVEFDQELPWLRVHKQLENGSLDMVTGLYWTSKRTDYLQYTKPYFVNEARVFVLKENQFEFQTVEDLQNKVGGLPTGGSYGEQFDTFAENYDLPIERVADKEQLIGKLLAGRNDYFILDFNDGMSFIKQSKLEQKIVALPQPVSVTEVFMAISKHSPCIKHLSSINELLIQIKQDGRLNDIIEKHVKPL